MKAAKTSHAPEAPLWSAATRRRFSCLADLSAKQGRAAAARREPGAFSTSTATSRLRKAVTSHRTPKACPSSAGSLAAPGHGGAVPAIIRGLSASDTPGYTAKRQAPRRGARLFARNGRRLAPLRGALPIARHTGGVVAALLNPRLMAGSLAGCAAAESAPALPTACDGCSPSPFAERGENLAGLSTGTLAEAEGRMRGFLPVGDDVRSLTSNADCRVRNAEPSQSLLTSAPTSQGNPSPLRLCP